MWSPTHVQVVVQRARNLLVKGKHGTNDAFVTIQLGKEKYQTSVKQKSEQPQWNEECELTIPDGNTSSIILTALHRNFVGLDKFLGQIQIPLNELYSNIYERSKSRWYQLEAKAGKPNTKNRGELEVKITFTVKSVTGSLMDLSKKPKKINSLPRKMVQSVGGSLMNLASKDKKLAQFPFKTLSNYGHKLTEKFPKRKSSKHKNEGHINENDSVQGTPEQGSLYDSEEEQYEPAPRVLETPVPDRPPPPKMREEKKTAAVKAQERERRRSISTLPQLTESPLENEESSSPKWNIRLRKMRISRSNPRRHTIEGGAYLDGLNQLALEESGKRLSDDKNAKEPVVPAVSEMNKTPPPAISARRNSLTRATPPPASNATPKKPMAEVRSSATPPTIVESENNFETPATKVMKHLDLGKLNVASSKILANVPKDKLVMFEKMSKEDLVELVVCQQTSIDHHLKQIRDLEDYIDELLVRVMETTPRLLQNPFKLSPSFRNDFFLDKAAKPKTVGPCNYL